MKHKLCVIAHALASALKLRKSLRKLPKAFSFTNFNYSKYYQREPPPPPPP
ncbi:MAG: hypothetical protein ABI686_09130 [Acidobacteriota bacterium]